MLTQLCIFVCLFVCFFSAAIVAPDFWLWFLTEQNQEDHPVGRILNRFASDVGCVDELLPKTFLKAVQNLLSISILILISITTNPWLFFLAFPLTMMVVYISKYYLKTARELKRLESISRSPVFSHFSETLLGLDTIRTRGRQADFVETFYR